MPYVNKPRPYKKEYKQQKARGKKEQERRNARERARYKLDKAKVNCKGNDIDHKKPLSKGRNNKRSNLKLVKPSKNRSFTRNSNYTVKRNKHKKK
mgnify:FL=1